MLRPRWCRGARARPGRGSTGPPPPNRGRASPRTKSVASYRFPPPTTCRRSPASRSTETSTSKSPARSTPCRGPGSDSTWTPAPTRCWSSCSTRASWSRPTPANHPAGGSPSLPTCPRRRPGYALRDLTKLIAAAAAHGKNIGIYAERLLDDPLPWTRMRAVYRLLGLVRRYGPEPVETACSTSLDLDVVSVTKIASMLAIATEKNPPCCRARPTPLPGGSPATPGVRHGRARHPAHPHPRRSDRPPTRKGDHPMSTPHPRDDQPDRSHRPLPGPARTEAVGAQRHPARTPRPGPDPQDGPRRVPGTPPVRRGLTPRLPLGDAACPHRRPGPHHGPRHLDQNPTTCATTGCCCPT